MLNFWGESRNDVKRVNHWLWDGEQVAPLRFFPTLSKSSLEEKSVCNYHNPVVLPALKIGTTLHCLSLQGKMLVLRGRNKSLKDT
jgi:hypothetical protein